MLCANETYNLHLNELAYRLAIGCYTTRKSCEYIRYSVALLNCFVAEEEGEPQGLPLCETCAGSATSLAVRSVALWVVGKPVGSFV